MANVKTIITDYNETGKTVYAIVRRRADNYLLNDADGAFAAAPTDPYLSLSENSTIKGRYEASESRVVWNNGLYDIAAYKQSGGSPSPVADTIIASGEIYIVADIEVVLDATISSRLASASYTAPDNASISAILVDTGTDGVVVAASSIDAIWDEVLTASTHNVANSAARKLRQITSFVLGDGTASAGTADSITLTGGVATDNIYTGCLIGISGGTGEGQSRYIVHYNGTTKVAKVARDWTVIPDATSTFVIFADGQTEFIKMGLAQTGSANTITLDSGASATDDIYNGQYIRILAGTGDDQLRTITDYDGTTKVATVDKNWVINPNSTSVFATLPDGHSGREEFFEKWINNKLVMTPTGVILYDDDNVSPIRTWTWDSGTATRGKAT